MTTKEEDLPHLALEEALAKQLAIAVERWIVEGVDPETIAERVAWIKQQMETDK